MNRVTAISACPLDCLGVCSFKVAAENNRVVSIEPNEENPITGKLICSKGRNHVNRINHPNRILEPMRRIGDGWEAISWDEALDFLTEKINAYRNAYGHQSIASFVGGGAAGKLKSVTELFFRHLGGGTVFGGGLCWSAGIKAQKLDFGRVLSHSPDDLLNCRSLILWGKNPADTHFHLLSQITKARKNGCHVILIDPITSASASLADHVIRPLPGTDWALATLVIQELLAKRLGSAEAVAIVSAQQPQLLKTIASCGRASLLKYCGVSEEDLSILAAAYGFRAPCSTYMSYGMQRCEHGGATIRMIDLLAYIAGQIGIPGGGANYANQVNSGLFDWSWAEPAEPVDAREFQQGTMGADIINAQDPPVKMFFIACANPAVQATDATLLAKALKSVETVVVIDHFMTDTAAMADIVLPATYFLEDEDIITSGMWNGMIHYAPRIVPPRGQARSELQIFTELAERLKLDSFPKLDEAQWLERIIGPLMEKGIHLKDLRERGWVPSPNQQDVPWADGVFHTENAMFNPLSSQTFASLLAALEQETLENTIPFLSTHARNTINSQHTMDLKTAFPEVMIHPDTAARYNISSGDRLQLTSKAGSIAAIAVIETNVRPDIAAVKEGFWKHEGQCINDLSPSGFSDLGGQALMNAARVTITKLSLKQP